MLGYEFLVGKNEIFGHIEEKLMQVLVCSVFLIYVLTTVLVELALNYVYGAGSLFWQGTLL